MTSPNGRSNIQSSGDHLSESSSHFSNHMIDDQSIHRTNKRESKSIDHSRPNDKRPRYQQSNESTTQITNDACKCQTPDDPLDVSTSLLTYSFLLPLVAEFLNGGDVVARVLIVNKLIRQMLPKYSFKRLCSLKEALELVQASCDIVFSATRVSLSAWSNEADDLVKLEQLDNGSLKEVHYRCHDRESLATIPRCATHLQLSGIIDSDNRIQMPAGMVPDSVVDLDIGFDVDLQVGSIPSSVKSLTLLISLDQFDAAMIPDTVTSLTLCHDDTKPRGILLGPFPASLKQLLMCDHHLPFATGVIPLSVPTLACNTKLLSVLEAGVIPNSVTNVDLQWFHNGVPKPGVLPDSLTSLHVQALMPVCFIPQWMPPSLSQFTLDVPDYMTHPNMKIPTGAIPDTLTHFQCNCDIEPGALPNGVTHVSLSWIHRGVLPPSVTHLRLCSPFFSYILPNFIPSSVTHLQFGCNPRQPMMPGIIPDSVTHLKFDYNFTCLITEGFIPQSVTHLTLGTQFNQPLSCDILPRNLTHLVFGDEFNQTINGNVIPRTVTLLVFGSKFNQPILPGDIPPSITHLEFGEDYTHELDRSNLPISLTHLEIPRGYLKSHDKLWLPSSVTHISYKVKWNHKRPEMSWNDSNVSQSLYSM